MNVETLLPRIGGEVLANKARAAIDGRIVILARLNGAEWVWTDEGHELMVKHSHLLAEEQAAKPTKKGLRKTAAQPVELLHIDPADYAEDTE